MLRATKIRIYPTPEQAAFLNAQFGAVRFAYNKALHIKKHAYQRHGVNLSPRNDLKPLLSVAKKSRKYAWLRIPLYSITDWHRSPISDSHPFDQPGT